MYMTKKLNKVFPSTNENPKSLSSDDLKEKLHVVGWPFHVTHYWWCILGLAREYNSTRAFNASALVGNSQQSTATTRVGAASTTAGPRESTQYVLETVSCCEIWIVQIRSTSESVVSRPAWLLFGMGVLQNLFLCNWWYLVFWISVNSIFNPNESWRKFISRCQAAALA